MYVTRHSLFNASPSVPLGIRQAFDRFLPAQDADVPPAASSQWSPRVDIREDEQRFVILADVPGIDPALIEVSMDNGVLSIKGAREAGNGSVAGDSQPGRFTRVERAQGEFLRRFSLPDSADADGITASGKHGVLEITIPKKPLPTPRRITINSGN
jgi:HSP20 family protein